LKFLNMSGTTPPPASAQANGSIVRLIHAALLLQGGGTMAREFWSGHPLEGARGSLSGADLHEMVWDEDAWYPMDWILRVLGSLESFCLRYGLDHQEFLKERMLGINGGCLLHPRACLRFAGENLGDLLRTPDVHLTMLRLLEKASNLVAAGPSMRLLRHEREGESLKAWVLLDMGCELPDVGFFELCSWVAMALETCPRRLGGDGFGSVRVLADLSNIEPIVAMAHRGEAPELVDGLWQVHGEVVARPVPLHEWLENNGLSWLESDRAPDSMVHVVERDWDCPLRGRRILRKGTAHGAPFGLFQIEWDLDDHSPAEAALRLLIGEALEGSGGATWSQAERLHRELLENDRHKLRFVYHMGDETISCNGTHLLRGVPAKILQKILIAHTITGRTLFEHREFRRDPDLKLDPSNPNLESRLRILSQRLEERLPAVGIIKAGRGCFRFESTVQVEYGEEGLIVT